MSHERTRPQRHMSRPPVYSGAIKTLSGVSARGGSILHMLAVREGEWKLIGNSLADLNDDPQPERKNYINEEFAGQENAA